MFSLKACLGVMEASGLGDNAVSAILAELREGGKIKDGYVLQTDLDKLIRKFKI